VGRFLRHGVVMQSALQVILLGYCT